MTLAVAPASGAPATVHQAVASAPIPFRKTSIVSGSEVFGMLVATLLVLAAFSALAWTARRRGWLDRWTRGAPGPGSQPSMTVLEVLRISRRTTLYRVGSGGQQYLVAESATPVMVTPLSAEPGVAS